MNLFSFLKQKSANVAVLDVGTSKVRYKVGDEVIKVSNYCMKDKSGSFSHVGKSAKELEGKVPSGMQVVRPLKQSVVVDYDALVAVLEEVKKKSKQQPQLIGTTVPYSASEVEINALVEAIKAVFKVKVFIFDSLTAHYFDPFIQKLESSFILDIGEGSTNMGVLHKGTIVHQNSLSVSGNQMDESIKKYLRKKYGIVIGNLQIEQLKTQTKSKKNIKVRGQRIRGGLPKELTIQSHEIGEAIKEQVTEIEQAVLSLFESISPQLVESVMDSGIVLTGGCSNIPLIAKQIKKTTKVSCITIERPMESALRGLEFIMDNQELRDSFHIQDLILK